MFALVLLVLLLRGFEYVACCYDSVQVQPPSNQELVGNLCKIKENTTLQDEFYEYVNKTYIPDGSRKIPRGREKYKLEYIDLNERHEITPYDILVLYLENDERCLDRGADEVQWCLHLWHPTQEITSCVNATMVYSTPFAVEGVGGIYLEYNEDCSEGGCLVIKCGRWFFDYAYVTMTISSGNCSVHDFYQLRLISKSAGAPSLDYFPPRVMFAEVGKRLSLQCEFGNVEFTYRGTWTDSSNIRLQPIEGHPDCDKLNSNANINSSNCYDGPVLSELPAVTKARKQRIRSYLTSESSTTCITYEQSTVFLIIDNLQFSDEGNYACLAESNNYQRTSYTVNVIPIYPVYEPVLKSSYNQSLVNLNHSYNQFNLVCEVVAGFDAKIEWVLPNGEVPEIFFITDMNEDSACDSDCYNSTSFVIGINTVLNSTTHTMMFYRKLTIFRNDSSPLSANGEYKCVATYNITNGNKSKILQTHQVTIISKPTVLPSFTSSTTASVHTTDKQRRGVTTTSSRSSTSSTFYRTSSSITLSFSNTDTGLAETLDDNLVVVTSSIVSGFLLLIVIVVSILLVFVIHKRCQLCRDSTNDVLHGKNLESSIFRGNSCILKEPSYSNKLSCRGYKNPLTHLNSESNREIARDKIEFGDKIDEGTFGQVVKAKLLTGKKNKETNVVAVKMTKGSLFSRTHRDDMMNIKEELDVMLSIQYHENVVNLIGHCTTPDGPMSIVMEFVPLGNLRDYLRSIGPSMFTFPAPHNRVILTNSGVSSSSSCSSGHPLLPVSIRALGHTPLSAQPSEVSTHSYICYSSDVTTPNQTTPTQELFSPNNSSVSSSSQEVSPSHKWTSPYNINNKRSFPDIDFENYAFQIAKGLSHLQSMNVIHCDLAARNILIAKDFTLKIGDFGMAKILGQNKDYHRRCRRDKIPVKWTAPEALESWKYTHKSDIWSYGVVLWEMASLGGIPYSSIPNHSAWDVMINYLKDGHRLQKPSTCPQSLYDVMMNCWKLSPDERPSAQDLVKQLNNSDHH